ncbi:hypothetical protein E3V39_12525 [Gammaproteobacteria bacterium LSUCC0112]|nr:hypothetical protein E3V39_12525 [Gammaproteobacteria bacterium LSUCC0112]
MSKNTDKNTTKGTSKLSKLIPWKPGQSGNLNGRPKGQRNYRTLYRIALEKIGETEGLTADQIEEILHGVGVMKALKGDFYFHKEIMDRVHGKPKDTLDIGAGGKTLSELMLAAAKTAKDGKATTKPRKPRGK